MFCFRLCLATSVLCWLLTGRVGSFLCSFVSCVSPVDDDDDEDSCSAAASLFAIERWSSNHRVQLDFSVSLRG